MAFDGGEMREMRDAGEIIENFREILKPAMAEYLKQIDLDGMGETDAEEFSREFEYILILASLGADEAADDAPTKELFYDEQNNVFRLRDTKYDIVIQCDSEEDHERAIRILESIGAQKNISPGK